MLKGLKKKKIKTMNSKMVTNSQLSTTQPKKPPGKMKTKETARTGTESEEWTSHGGFSVGRGRERVKGRKGTGKKGRHTIDRERLRMV